MLLLLRFSILLPYFFVVYQISPFHLFSKMCFPVFFVSLNISKILLPRALGLKSNPSVLGSYSKKHLH